MKIYDISITSNLKHIERNVRNLIFASLEPWNSQIDIIAVKIKKAFVEPLNLDGFHCSILIKTLDGKTFRSDSRNSDEMLVVYDALSKIIDGSTSIMEVGEGRQRHNAKISHDYNNLDNFNFINI